LVQFMLISMVQINRTGLHHRYQQKRSIVFFLYYFHRKHRKLILSAIWSFLAWLILHIQKGIINCITGIVFVDIYLYRSIEQACTIDISRKDLYLWYTPVLLIPIFTDLFSWHWSIHIYGIYLFIGI